MKFIGNIVCTIAILTQIILSVGLLSHAPDCNVAQPISTSEATHTTHNPHHHHCSCDHHHHTEKVNTEEFTTLSDSVPPSPPHDCTCTPQKNHPYILSDQIAEQKPKKHLIDANSIASTQVDSSQFSLTLCQSNQSNAPPPPWRSKPIYLSQQDARFASTHLGVFLI